MEKLPKTNIFYFMKKFLWFLFLPITLFAQILKLPQPYSEFIKKLLPPNWTGKITYTGDGFHAVIEVSKNGGSLITTISENDFLSFYRQLYKQTKSQKIKTVSLKITYKGNSITYNPFFQIWDESFGIPVLSLSKLKPTCRGPVLKIKADKVVGTKIMVPFKEIEKFFQNGFIYPAYYCP